MGVDISLDQNLLSSSNVKGVNAVARTHFVNIQGSKYPTKARGHELTHIPQQLRCGNNKSFRCISK